MRPPRHLVVAMLVWWLTCAVPAAADASAAPVAGTSAAFSDSIGVGIAPFYDDTTYDNKARLKQLLVDLGVKHVRAGVRLGRYAYEYASARDIAAAGIKFMWITGRPNSSTDPGTPDQTFGALSDPARLAGTTDALEGPNEYDVSGDSAWQERLYQFMSTFYAYAKGSSTFKTVPFYGPSFAFDQGANSYASLPGSGRLMDAPNGHPYAGGRAPEARLDANIPQLAAEFGDSNRKPVISEAGYHTAINNGNWGHYGVSERAQAIYLLRTYLEAFALGVPRTYIFQLLDNKPEAANTNMEMHFGIVGVSGDPSAAKSTWTVTPKAAYGSIQELLKITRDSGLAAGPGSLDYSLSGAPSTLHRLLLSRSDGSADLVLWNAVPVYNDPIWDCNDPRIPPSYTDPTARCEYAKYNLAQDQGDAYPADVPVTLTLADRARVSTERPYNERAFTSLGEGRTFNLNVGADPIFVRVNPEYGLAVRTDNPVAWLRLDETSGNPVDSAGRGATTGAWVASPTYAQPGAVADGDTAIAVQGNENTTVRLPTPVSTGTGATVEMWVKPDPATANFTEFLTANTPDWRVRMRTYDPHDGLFWGSTYGSRAGASGEMIFPGFDYGQWHHLVITMASGLSTTYLDGRQVGSTSGGDSLNVSAFTIGANGANGGFTGLIDEFAVYPTALSQGRVCAHYRAAGGTC